MKGRKLRELSCAETTCAAHQLFAAEDLNPSSCVGEQRILTHAQEDGLLCESNPSCRAREH